MRAHQRIVKDSGRYSRDAVLDDIGPYAFDQENGVVTLLRPTCADPSNAFKITVSGAVAKEDADRPGKASSGIPVRNITRVFYGEP